MKKRKGIILAGGLGSRFFPVTNSISKHLLPIYDKPMIFYSLSTLMLADVREILIITTARDEKIFKNLLGDGSNYGINFEYLIQESPDGIPQAFILAEDFLNGSPSLLILGDNFFYGDGLQKKLLNITKDTNNTTIFGYRVRNPEDYGVIEFDPSGNIITFHEKPKNFISDIAITGIYFFDENAPKFSKELKFSSRGELEITDLNKIYLKQKKLKLEILGRGFTWLDAGTPDNLIEAAHFVQTIEHRQGFKICCPEEIAFNKKWLSKEDILKKIESNKNTDYYKYIVNLLKI